MIIIIKLLIGLFIFLMAMKVMTHTLQTFSMDTLKEKLQAAVNHPLKGLLFGTLCTAIIQSSSAITVLVVSLVEAKLLTLFQAATLIMGANIGTTMTTQLLSLNLTACIPYFIGGGLCLCLIRKPLIRQIGYFFTSLGFLFLGLHLMKLSMAPIIDSHYFISIILRIQDAPFLCLLLGMMVTFVIQSSSASTAILLTLVSANAISLPTAIWILLGHEIGTCLTALLASLSGGRAGKQTALFHLLFNLSGVLLFLPFSIPVIEFTKLFSATPERQLANVQLLFNLLSVLCLFPFISIYIRFILKLLPLSSKTKQVPLFSKS